MFRCEVCNDVVPPGTELNRIPAETRERRYPFRREANPCRIPGKKKARYRDDPGGHGHELVSELEVCPPCARRHANPASEREAA